MASESSPGIRRRDVVRVVGTAAAGAALRAAGPAVAGALAACARPLPPRRPGLERELRIYNWSDYIAPGVRQAFEDETGVRVTYDTFDSTEELLAKLLAGGPSARAYDLIVPSGFAVPMLARRGLIQPLDHALLPGLDAIAPPFRDTVYDPGLRVALPWLWGVTGLAWRADRLAEPGSWAALDDARVAGRATMLDDGREVLGAMLRWRGASVNSTDAAQLARARADAIRVKRNVRAWVNAPVKGQLITGDVWLAQLWNGDARQAATEAPEVRFRVPDEGAMCWTDFAAIPTGCRSPRAAHAFLAFVLRPAVAAAIADATGYGSPNEAALRRQAAPVPLPGDRELARMEYQLDLGDAAPLWDRLWTEVKAA